MIESVQGRAARFVTSTYNQTSSVTTMLFRLLEQCHKIAKATMMYKILHNIVIVPLTSTGHPLATIFTRGHSQRFHQVAVRVNAYLCSFFPSAIKLWISLPESVIQARDVEEFKRLIRNYYTISL